TDFRSLGRTPTSPERLPAGSYVIAAESEGGPIRYPLLIARAQRHHVRLRLPKAGELPEDMVLIPGGPFLSWNGNKRRISQLIPDFGIGRLPVRAFEYVEFLDALTEPEQARRMPAAVKGGPFLERAADGGWRLGPRVVEGDAKNRVPRDRELEIPITEIS